MELNPAKINYVTPAKLDDANIVEFPCDKSWRDAQKMMYAIKTASNALGLRNGQDYLFLKRQSLSENIRVWYRDQSIASQIAWQMYINE